MARSLRNPFTNQRFNTFEECSKNIRECNNPELSEMHIESDQCLFNYINRYPLSRRYGRCTVSGKPTTWNPVSKRYNRFHSQVEATQYAKEFKAKMRQKYGADHILNQPDVQKRMLERRKISGKYIMTQYRRLYEQDICTEDCIKVYTGSYELDFLTYLDYELFWDPRDVVCPAPMEFEYTLEGKTHFYIPDFWFPSLDLLVEIKASDNNHYRRRDIEIERIKDNVVGNTSHFYVKIFDKDYGVFHEMLDILNDSLASS